MSLFNWFSGKSGAADGEDSAPSVREKAAHAGRQPAIDPTQRGEERKVKRHARREQLYVAVREAMTRSGVLSASYKFKVLSLDQAGNQFLVMMDLGQDFGAQIDKLHEVEHEIVQTARARFEILVTSVYWRVEQATPAARHEHDAGRTAALHPPLGTAAAAVAAARKKPAARFEPIQADEVAAFKQALAAASAASPVGASQNAKGRGGPRSYTLLTGFEDTEMPDSPAVPALSATQYGDLN